MKDNLDLLKDRVETYLNTKNPVNTLKKSGISFEDATRESGYLNFRFYGKNGYVRAYKAEGMKKFKVQIFRQVELKYSGIPVFEPSGRKSF